MKDIVETTVMKVARDEHPADMQRMFAELVAAGLSHGVFGATLHAAVKFLPPAAKAA